MRPFQIISILIILLTFILLSYQEKFQNQGTLFTILGVLHTIFYIFENKHFKISRTTIILSSLVLLTSLVLLVQIIIFLRLKNYGH